MTSTRVSHYHVLFTLALAAFFWYLTFGLELFNFWLSMAVAASVLAGLGILFQGTPVTGEDFNLRSLIVGVAAAVVLYFLFWLGYTVSQWIFPFAEGQVNSIYHIRTQGQAIIIALVLLFVTSPAEEIFWRGFIQKWSMDKWGREKGWLVGAVLYAGVHIFSGNFMLLMAALVAGLFWGWLYLKVENLAPCIISHCLWTVGIFLLFPVV